MDSLHKLTHGDESSRDTVVNDEPLLERLALVPSGLDEFTGFPARGFDQRVFGGHLLAQALLAATHSVEAGRVGIQRVPAFLQRSAMDPKGMVPQRA